MSESLALASLEVLVHCELDLVPADLVALEVMVPDSVGASILSMGKLPRNWRRYPAPAALQRHGNAWLDSVDGCVLRVPSAVIPSESNFLINPRHPDIRKIRVARKFDFRLDARVVAR